MSWSKVFPSFNFLFFLNPYLKNSFPMRQIFDPFVFCILPSLSLSWLANAAAHIFCLETMDHMLCHLNLWPRGSFIPQRPKCFSCPGYVTSCSIITKHASFCSRTFGIWTYPLLSILDFTGSVQFSRSVVSDSLRPARQDSLSMFITENLKTKNVL